VKHMIVLTDGLTHDAEFDKLVERMRTAKISVTTVAVGSDANVPLLQSIARNGRGKFYAVINPRNLPRIFLREVRRVSRPLVYEPPAPVTPVITSDHEILSGVEGGVPPITGLVLTTVKENPLVEVVLRSPQPATQKNATVLATWTYGAGKAAAFTTDAGRRWAAAWPQWPGYDKFFSQLVRWAMRPTGDTGNYSVATNVRDGRTQIVVTAMDANEDFINDRAMSAWAMAPKGRVDVQLEQTAPGRYVGEFPSDDAGTYLIAIDPGGGAAPIRTGVNVGYSPEYRDHETNLPLLESRARGAAGGRGTGEVVVGGFTGAEDDERAASSFRHDLPAVKSSQPIWPWLVVAASCVFWADVFVRRVQLNLAWLPPALGRLRDRVLRRTPVAAPVETMRRLRSRKDEITDRIASQRAARFEDDRDPSSQPEGPPVIAAQASTTTPRRPAAPAAPTEEQQGPASYTERLLQAKKAAQRKPPRDDRRPER
jgi:hypothetical protein